jgi:hypothetical protein
MGSLPATHASPTILGSRLPVVFSYREDSVYIAVKPGEYYAISRRKDRYLVSAEVTMTSKREELSNVITNCPKDVERGIDELTCESVVVTKKNHSILVEDTCRLLCFRNILHDLGYNYVDSSHGLDSSAYRQLHETYRSFVCNRLVVFVHIERMHGLNKDVLNTIYHFFCRLVK